MERVFQRASKKIDENYLVGAVDSGMTLICESYYPILISLPEESTNLYSFDLMIVNNGAGLVTCLGQEIPQNSHAHVTFDPVDHIFVVAIGGGGGLHYAGIITDISMTETFESATPTIPISGDWYRVTTSPYAGSYCLKSGTNTPSGVSESTLTVVTPVNGNLTFYYKVSSEAYCDKFYAYLDNVVKVNGVSGTIAWTLATIAMTAGTHALKLRYVKDGSVSSGLDAVFIDNVSFTGVSNVPFVPDMDDDGKYLKYVADQDAYILDDSAPPVVIPGVAVWVETDYPPEAQEKDVLVKLGDYSRYDVRGISTGASDTVAQAEVVEFTGTSPFSYTLSSVDATAGCIKKLINSSTAMITLVATINGSTANVLYPKESMEIIHNGTGWRIA